MVGWSSCFAKNQRAGFIVPISFPSRKTVMCPVIICLFSSLVTVMASCRTVKPADRPLLSRLQPHVLFLSL